MQGGKDRGDRQSKVVGGQWVLLPNKGEGPWKGQV